MVGKLAAADPGQPVQINLALAGFTMDTIGAAAFGYVTLLCTLPCDVSRAVSGRILTGWGAAHAFQSKDGTALIMDNEKDSSVIIVFKRG